VSEYTNQYHENAFIDFPGKQAKEKFSYHPSPAECPKCFGYGGWNIRINAYKLRDGMENTPENRHRHVHFRASCDQCNGWGWLNPKNASCVHDFSIERNVGRCLTENTCSKCGYKQTIDSSD
jgi:hypothetical protein